MTGKHKQRGFSLIEAAIVLAVVGLVLGGIWVAAAAMYESYKVNKTVDGFLLISNKMQNMVSLRDAKQAWGCGGCDIPDSFNINVVPGDWIRGSKITSPIGGDVDIVDYSGAMGVYVETFRIDHSSLSKSLCIRFVVALSKTNPLNQKNRSLQAIHIRDQLGGGSLGSFSIPCPACGPNRFPASAEQAASVCLSTQNEVMAFFPYTRTN